MVLLGLHFGFRRQWFSVNHVLAREELHTDDQVHRYTKALLSYGC